MSDPSDAPTVEARIADLIQQAEDTAVHQHGLSRAYVREVLSGQGVRVYANPGGGPLRILASDGSGNFLPATRDDARAAALLAKEIAASAPEEALMDLVQQHEEERGRSGFARDPAYRL